MAIIRVEESTTTNGFSRGKDFGYQYPLGLDISPGSKLHTRIIEKIMRRARPGKTSPQRNIIAVKTAASQGGGYVYMETGTRKGIYGVWGSEENPQVNLIYDLSHRTTKIPKNEWFDPAVQVGVNNRAKHWGRALRFQLKRAGLSTQNF